MLFILQQAKPFITNDQYYPIDLKSHFHRELSSFTKTKVKNKHTQKTLLNKDEIQ